jgi:hypothetical protein
MISGRQVKFMLAILAVVVGLGSPAAMFADTDFSFTGTVPSGTAQFSTTSGIFSVDDAEIDTLTTIIGGVSTQYAISGGELDITSGAGAILSGCTGNSCLAVFNAGGSLDITGGVASLGIASTTLLSSDFLADGVLSFSDTNGVGTGFYSANLDPTDTALLAALLGDGIVNSASDTEMNIQLGFSGDVYSGPVASSSVSIVDSVAAPEPSELPLLLIGLMALGFLALRKRSVLQTA